MAAPGSKEEKVKVKKKKKSLDLASCEYSVNNDSLLGHCDGLDFEDMLDHSFVILSPIGNLFELSIPF